MMESVVIVGLLAAAYVARLAWMIVTDGYGHRPPPRPPDDWTRLGDRWTLR